MKTLRMSALVTLALLVSPVLAAASAALENEVIEFIDIYDSGSSKRMSKANEQLIWTGLSDPQLFDVIANRLETEKNSKKENSLLIEALGYSGNRMYTSTLETMAEKSGYRKKADKALQALSQHRVWNPIISQGIEDISAQRLKHHRIINMIESAIPELEWEGARLLFQTHNYDETAIQAAQKVLEEGFNKNTVSGTHIDAMAYLIKVMIGSGDRAVVPLLLEIYDTAIHKKMRRYAEDALERFDVDLN